MKTLIRVIEIIVGIIIFISGAIQIFNVFFGTNSNSKISKDVPKEEKFILESSELTHGDWGSAYIEGTIKNNTDDTYSYVQVTFNLYDEEGNQIGTAWTNINYLQPKGTWKYKAPAFADNDGDIYRYELAKISGW